MELVQTAEQRVTYSSGLTSESDILITQSSLDDVVQYGKHLIYNSDWVIVWLYGYD